MLDVTIFQIISYFCNCHLRTVIFRLFCRSSKVWCDNCTFDSCHDWCWEICHIVLNMSGNKCIYYCLFINQDISCIIQNDNTIFHKTNRILVNHTFCTIHSRHMDRDIITIFIKLINGLCMMNISGQSPCCIHRQIWIISVNFHSKMYSCISNKNTDGSKSNDSQLLTFDFATGKLFLCLFGIF